MPETFDPNDRKNEYYSLKEDPNKRRYYTPYVRRKSIFSNRMFIFGYGIFLIIAVMGITAYKNNGLHNLPIIKHFIKNKTMLLTVENVVDSNNFVDINIKLENLTYKHSKIDMLIADVLLYSGEDIIASNVHVFNNISFEKKSAIGFSTRFKYQNWTNSQNMFVKLYFDDKYILTDTFRIKKRR